MTAEERCARDVVSPVPGAARYGHVNSRGEAAFADTPRSAPCVRFGAHQMKPAVSGGGA